MLKRRGGGVIGEGGGQKFINTYTQYFIKYYNKYAKTKNFFFIIA